MRRRIGPLRHELWATSHEDREHVRKIMLSAAYFSGMQAMVTLTSGVHLTGCIVSTKLGSDAEDGQAGQMPTKIYGEIYILPDVGRLVVLQALEIEALDRA